MTRVSLKGTSAAAVVLTLATWGCSTTTDVVEITGKNATAYEPSLAVFRDSLAVSWYDTRDGRGELYARRFGGDRQPLGSEVRLTNSAGNTYEPDIHPIEGHGPADGFVVGWYEKNGDDFVAVYLGLWAPTGTPRWTRTLARRGRNVVVRVDPAGIFAAWVQDENATEAGLWSGWWSLQGEVLRAPRRVADASKTTYNVNAALVPASGEGLPTALVAFDALVRTRAEEIYLTIDDGGAPQAVRLTPDDGFASKYPDLDLSGSRAALTWFDAKTGNEEIYLRVLPLGDLSHADALGGTRLTNTAGHSIGAYAAWNGDRLGIAWCDDTEGQYEIYFAEFDPSGAQRAPARRLTETRLNSMIPEIHAWRTGFALVWIEYEGAGGHDEQGRSQVLLKLIP